VPRDEHFAALVRTLVKLYTCSLEAGEMVLCLDEKTNVQPRCRVAPTLPTQPRWPTRLEHEYKRGGALHLFAAFDTRTGRVYARTAPRKRQVELIEFLTLLEHTFPASTTRIFLILDNVKMHKGKLVQAWLGEHPRFVCHFTPVHCSWMNQVEQWFSILQAPPAASQRFR